MLDDEFCFKAALAKDRRFDGVFIVAVSSTHIYCRPSCPAMTPKREHMRFFPTAASVHALGYRACKRCRPDASPGSPEWNARGDVVARAMRLITDGLLDHEGVVFLAQRLGYSERQLRRQMQAELGTGPLAIARAQRAETARILLESSALLVGEVAYAAGFSSIRQFNDTMRELYAEAPRELRVRAARKVQPPSLAETISIRLAYRAPFDATWTLSFLGTHAVSGIESYRDGLYQRVLNLSHAPGIVSLKMPDDVSASYVECELDLLDLRDLSTAVARCRRLLDLDADPLAIDEVLAADPMLASSVAENPGRRVPGHVDPNELVVRALLGQQVSVKGAQSATAALVKKYGVSLERPTGSLSHVFPGPEALLEVDPADLRMPQSRKRAFYALNDALSKRKIVLDYGVDRDVVRSQLLELPGIGPWTASYLAVRALSDPDAFLVSDLGVKKAFERVGEKSDVRSIEAREQLAAVARVCLATPLVEPELARPWPNEHWKKKATLPERTPVSSARVTTKPAAPLHRATGGFVEPKPETTCYSLISSPVGELLALSDGTSLTGLYLDGARHAASLSPAWVRDEALFAEVVAQLEEYFSGDRQHFELSLAPSGTPFQLEVWEALCEIGYGETASYIEVARRVGRPKAPRAVGSANGRNPIAIVVPCHRVIAADHSLGGYGGGLERKKLLLELERG